MRRLITVLFIACSAAFGQGQIKAVLDDFSQARRVGGDGHWMPEHYDEGEGQTDTVTAGVYRITGAPPGCGSPNDCGIYWYWQVGPDFAWSTPCTDRVTCGYLQATLRSGTWNANYNRMGMKFKCNGNVNRRSDGGDVFQLGTFVREKSSVNVANAEEGGDHYYHLFDWSIHANEWMWMEINWHPQHRRGAAGSTNYPNDPESQNGHYLDTMTNFYWDSQEGMTGMTCDFDIIGFWDDIGKAPEEFVSSVALTYTGTAYEVTWAGVKNAYVTYDVRHSTAGSLRTLGWSAGTNDGTAETTGDDYVGVIRSFTAARADNIWVGIRPRMPISSATGGTPITLNYPIGHSLTTGDQVVISSVCANANGTRTVTVVDRDTVTLQGTSGTCSYSSGGTTVPASDTEGFYEIAMGDGVGEDPPGTAPTITTTCPLPAGTVGVPYSQTLTATGDPATFTWSITGSPPANMSFSTSGSISGTPTQAGTSNFTLGVTNGVAPDASLACSLTINAAPRGMSFSGRWTLITR